MPEIYADWRYGLAVYLLLFSVFTDHQNAGNKVSGTQILWCWNLTYFRGLKVDKYACWCMFTKLMQSLSPFWAHPKLEHLNITSRKITYIKPGLSLKIIKVLRYEVICGFLLKSHIKTKLILNPFWFFKTWLRSYPGFWDQDELLTRVGPMDDATVHRDGCHYNIVI